MRNRVFRLTLILLLALAPPALNGATGAEQKKQERAPAAEKSRFLIRLMSLHPEAAASEDEKARIVMHFEYLKALQSDGTLVLAGISTDDYAGIVIVEAAGRAEAERIVASDPAVSGNVYQAEIHPFRVVLSGGDR